jgi:predicted enzyme related to lactoylglutathione lyase
MPSSRSPFIWYELMTTDTAGAKAFYSKVVGWTASSAPPPNDKYTLLTAGAAGQPPAAGLMELPEGARTMGTPPGWIGYVLVEDVDAKAEDVKRLGGTVHMPPTNIPGVGRFSVFADPQGAALALFKPDSAPPDMPAPAPGTPGRIGWHELMTTDWQKAIAFYSALFGWTKADAIDMPEIGTYQMFTTGDANVVGGMFNKPPMVPATFWLYYFNVDNIDAAVERVKGGGGQIMMGPMEVPGGDWIIQGTDPQGAMFALVGKK